MAKCSYPHSCWWQPWPSLIFFLEKHGLSYSVKHAAASLTTFFVIICNIEEASRASVKSKNCLAWPQPSAWLGLHRHSSNKTPFYVLKCCCHHLHSQDHNSQEHANHWPHDEDTLQCQEGGRGGNRGWGRQGIGQERQNVKALLIWIVLLEAKTQQWMKPPPKNCSTVLNWMFQIYVFKYWPLERWELIQPISASNT